MGVTIYTLAKSFLMSLDHICTLSPKIWNVKDSVLYFHCCLGTCDFNILHQEFWMF